MLAISDKICCKMWTKFLKLQLATKPTSSMYYSKYNWIVVTQIVLHVQYDKRYWWQLAAVPGSCQHCWTTLEEKWHTTNQQISWLGEGRYTKQENIHCKVNARYMSKLIIHTAMVQGTLQLVSTCIRAGRVGSRLRRRNGLLAFAYSCHPALWTLE